MDTFHSQFEQIHRQSIYIILLQINFADTISRRDTSGSFNIHSGAIRHLEQVVRNMFPDIFWNYPYHKSDF